MKVWSLLNWMMMRQHQPQRKEGVLSRLLGDVITTKTTEKPLCLEMIRSEVQCYCHEIIAELSDDPLKWCSMQEVQYVHQ